MLPFMRTVRAIVAAVPWCYLYVSADASIEGESKITRPGVNNTGGMIFLFT